MDHIRLIAALAIGTLAACSQTQTEFCGGTENWRCPPDFVCVETAQDQYSCVQRSVCGDGRVSEFAGEACDDGNLTDGDGCSALCMVEECGNSIIDPGEECDDGNIIGGDLCSSRCKFEICGNAVLDEGEACDDGNNDDGDGCSGNCLSDETCGNGYQDLDEVCDDGNTNDGDGCRGNCLSIERCGDGILGPGEVCDDGNTDDGDGCSGNCLSDETCGNGVLDMLVGEICDDNNTSDGDGCSADCASDETCGNGLLDSPAGEVCDDGNATSGDGCSGDCLSDETCGNGYHDPAAGEACDDGNTSSNDGCSQDCLSDETCGNGYPDVLEVCDDGNLIDGDGCSADCRSDETCGNSIIDSAVDEVCEDGNLFDGDGCSADCRSNETCGNGVEDVILGEACDDGNLVDGDGCSALCALPECGNGIEEGLEVCDDGNNANGDGCNAMCTSNESCGNGVIDVPIGESCDDGNQLDGDDCPASCKIPVCGDGILDFGEECDDMGDSATCDDDCTSVVCGDGHANDEAGEECDDAGVTDACDGDCTLALCGDGYVNAAASEQCDTFGDSAACDSDCTNAMCGDGHLNTVAGEECDDGDNDNTNACDNGCTLRRQIAAGGAHTCTLRPDGAVKCWGDAGSGQLGYGDEFDIGDNEFPDTVGTVDIGDLVERVSLGGDHSCALLQTGTVRCWGEANSGQLGYGNTVDIGDTETPQTAGDVPLGLAPGIRVTQVQSGRRHTCALTETGAVRCWGRNFQGQLGYGHVLNIGDDEPAATGGDVPVGGPVVQIAVGASHTCALLQSGRVRCWGDGANGRLGYGNTLSIGDDEFPNTAGDVPVSAAGQVVEIAAGFAHTCARLTSGAVRCWGLATDGRLGYGNLDSVGDDEVPSSVGDVELGVPAVQIVTGAIHTCALLANGAVRCWGYGGQGALGYGNTNTIGDNETPASTNNILVSSSGSTVIQIVAGERHTCALLTSGSIHCWGLGINGRLGYGNSKTIGDNEHPESAGNVPY